MNLQAKLIKKEAVQKGMGKNGEWQKQNFIFETTGQYPKKVCVSVWGDKVNDYASLVENNDYDVAFDVESREYNGNWYTDVRAWKIDALGGEAKPKPSSQQNQTPPPPVDFSGSDNSDALPF